MKTIDVRINCSSGPDTAYLRIEDPKSGITILDMSFTAEEWGRLCLCTSGLKKTVEAGDLELIGMNDRHEKRIVWIQEEPPGLGYDTPQRTAWFVEQVQRWAKPGERASSRDADNHHRLRLAPGPCPEGEKGSWREVIYRWYEDDNGEVYIPPEERLSLSLLD